MQEELVMTGMDFSTSENQVMIRDMIRKFGDEHISLQPAGSQHLIDQRARRRNDGQTIGPAAGVAQFDLPGRVDRDAAVSFGRNAAHAGWPSSNSKSTFSVSASARSAIAPGGRFASGWGIVTKRNPGTPQSLAISFAAASNTSVMIGTAGMPSFSSVIASSRLPDEQAPQSPTPTITKSTLPRSSAI